MDVWTYGSMEVGRPPQVPASPPSTPPHLHTSILRLAGVSRSFGGIKAVDDLSFELEQGVVTGLIGPNGAGKTTIFNLITGFLSLDAGCIHYQGRRIDGQPPYRIAGMGVARSFQDLRLFPKMTVLENVMVARQGQLGENVLLGVLSPPSVRRQEAANREQAMQHLRFVRLQDKAGALAEDLSYGQQKLLAIARLLNTEADLLLLDEPMSGLDPAILRRMVELIQQLEQRGKTICLIEHNLDVVREVCSWALFLDQGHAVAAGPAAQIMSDPGLADIYFGV